MKRTFILSLAILICSFVHAQLNGNGYYRVKNNGTGNYIWVCDNTGDIKIATTSADMGAIQLWNGLDTSIPEAASVLYFENKGGNTWNISAQGTSIYDLVKHNIELSSATKNGVTLYEVSASEGSNTLYLFDGGEIDESIGYNVLKTSGTVANRKWRIEPITSDGDNFFGIKPSITAGNKYYEPFYASFPFSFASSGMKAYYISKVDGNIAVMKEITTDAIPAKTPVLIECSSSDPKNNRVNLLTSTTATLTGNQLKGVFFCNEFRTSSADAIKKYDASTMRVWNKNAQGKLALNSDKSTLHTNWYGDDGNRYLNANSCYLPVASGTAAEMTLMTEEEYNNREILVENITLNKTSETIKLGETLQLTATVSPSNATNKNVTWSSSNSNIATVSSNGLVTSKAVGNVTITVKANDGSNKSASCNITVNPILATSITLNKTQAEILNEQTLQLSATVSPANATNATITWSSANNDIATVNSNGLVTAQNVGKTTIYAKTTDGSNLSASCEITVKPILVETISLSQTTAEIKEHTTVTLTATIGPSNATNKTVTWTTSDSNIATVSDKGVVEGKSIGNATITATATDGSGISASCQVNVSENIVYAESINISQEEAELTINDVLQLSATVLPADATNTSVTWTSSVPEVASVSQDGKVTALKDGVTIITATANGGQNVSASCKITIKPIYVTGIVISPSNAELVNGDNIQLSVTIEPENATYKDVTWTSSNEQIAKVDYTGLVTMLTEGSVVITATSTDGSNISATSTITCIIDGIKEIIANSDDSTYYSIDGKQISKARKGLNIVRTKDGKIYKVFIK